MLLMISKYNQFARQSEIYSRDVVDVCVLLFFMSVLFLMQHLLNTLNYSLIYMTDVKQ